jgi:sugar phosphate permease
MQNAMGVDHSRLAFLMTLYGAVAIPSYLLGGFIADKFNPTKMIVAALLGVGGLGLYYSTMPSFEIVLVIQFFMAIFSIGIYFPALIKTTRFISDSTGQGLGFGALEGGRKLSYFVFNAMFIAGFQAAGEGVLGLKRAILIIGIQCLAMAIIVFFAFRGINYNKMAEEAGHKVNLSKVIPLLKKPVVWLISLIILFVYVSSAVQGYVTSYLVNVFGMGEAASAWFFTFTQFAAPLVVVLGGWLTDKAGIGKGMLITQFLLLITVAGLLLVPAGPAFLIPAMVSLLVFLVSLYVVRGIYWALVDYAKIPKLITGTALGVIMMICYTPDFFMYNLVGGILDANPGAAGYHIMFIVQLICVALSIVLMFVLKNYLQNKSQSNLYSDICDNCDIAV